MCQGKQRIEVSDKKLLYFNSPSNPILITRPVKSAVFAYFLFLVANTSTQKDVDKMLAAKYNIVYGAEDNMKKTMLKSNSPIH